MRTSELDTIPTSKLYQIQECHAEYPFAGKELLVMSFGAFRQDMQSAAAYAYAAARFKASVSMHVGVIYYPILARGKPSCNLVSEGL